MELNCHRKHHILVHWIFYRNTNLYFFNKIKIMCFIHYLSFIYNSVTGLRINLNIWFIYDLLPTISICFLLLKYIFIFSALYNSHNYQWQTFFFQLIQSSERFNSGFGINFKICLDLLINLCEVNHENQFW